MSINVDNKGDVLFIEANFSIHPERQRCLVYACCTQDKVSHEGGTHIEWHQHWETGVSEEVLLTAMPHRSVLRDEFNKLADNLEDHIRDERSKAGIPDSIFVRVFDDSQLDRLLEHVKSDEPEAA